MLSFDIKTWGFLYDNVRVGCNAPSSRPLASAGTELLYGNWFACKIRRHRQKKVRARVGSNGKNLKVLKGILVGGKVSVR